MGRACCVQGCPSGGDAPSHQIPKNPALFQKWKNLIYSEKLQHLTDEQISKCAVCYRHFADDDYLVTFRVRKLKRGVAPSLNLPNHPTFVTIKTEPQALDADTSMFAASRDDAEWLGSQRVMRVPDTNRIKLFEDPDEIDFFDQLEETLPEKRTDEQQINSTTLETLKLNHTDEMLNHTDETLNHTDETLNHRGKPLRKKQKKLSVVQLPLLRRKKQAKRYEKTPTIQKLLSFLTPAEIVSIQTKIQKSKYSPRVYVRVYHNIAKRRAFDPLV
ncbi:uncharacterized protein LOC105828854 [Monomorium pharaonis]|uniref:uncharacterized protein LOC105828854 n=1 Tax=Monomorium pharaonis TaxID=307658 RepID=UPI00063F8D51|nr:uncharacterized protein LOC105828854 [Monomorium pharaonis]XP_012522860.1 uncharacterized protein LOC105828854 [Monomorium pharaonis]XP_028047965.1 uncharacterized protein LOC105828854 [Monomorium pharaonis]